MEIFECRPSFNERCSLVRVEKEDRENEIKMSSFRVTREEVEDATNEMVLKGTLRELFGMSVYRRNLIIMVILWSFGAFSFFIVPFYIGTIDLNIYMMNLATAVGEIIATFICLFLVSGRDKRKLTALFMFIVATSSVALILLIWLY